MAKKRTNNQFLPKDKFTTPVSFVHIAAMSRSGFETQWSETENKTRLWGHKTEKRPRL